jgi:hypothetical protein
LDSEQRQSFFIDQRNRSISFYHKSTTLRSSLYLCIFDYQDVDADKAMKKAPACSASACG